MTWLWLVKEIYSSFEFFCLIFYRHGTQVISMLLFWRQGKGRCLQTWPAVPVVVVKVTFLPQDQAAEAEHSTQCHAPSMGDSNASWFCFLSRLLSSTNPHSPLLTICDLQLSGSKHRTVQMSSCKSACQQAWWPEFSPHSACCRREPLPKVVLWALGMSCGMCVPTNIDIHLHTMHTNTIETIEPQSPLFPKSLLGWILDPPVFVPYCQDGRRMGGSCSENLQSCSLAPFPCRP